MKKICIFIEKGKGKRKKEKGKRKRGGRC